MPRKSLTDIFASLAGVDESTLNHDFEADGYRDFIGKQRVVLSDDEKRIFEKFLFGTQPSETPAIAPYIYVGDGSSSVV